MKKILIIEDDASFAESLKAKLTATFQVELCPDGQSGYYAIYEYKPDLVLLSLTIAQMDAVSLIGKMRVQKQFQKLQILALADQKTLGRADDALAAGAHQALLKDEEGAVDTVASALTTMLAPSLARRTVAQPQYAPAAPVFQAAPSPTLHPAVAPTLQAASVAATADPGTQSWTRGRFNLPLSQPAADVDLAFQKSGRAHLDYLGDVRTAEDVTVRQVHGFLDHYGQKAHAVRQEFIRYRTAGENVRRDQLKVLIEKIAELHREAGDCGLVGLGRYLAVIEARVRQLFESSNPASPSSLLGIATALDSLAALNNHVEELEPLNNLHPLALVVDDDAVCRKTLSLGLEKSKIKTTGVDNPDAALLEAESKPFDLIFLDVDLPKMNGFALCARIRIIPSHRKTPILFVTSLSDIKSRASSRVSGGNDFITKPINLYELGINSWTLIINRRVLQNGARPRAERA